MLVTCTNISLKKFSVNLHGLEQCFSSTCGVVSFSSFSCIVFNTATPSSGDTPLPSLRRVRRLWTMTVCKTEHTQSQNQKLISLVDGPRGFNADIHRGACTQMQCFVLFSFGSSSYQLGCSVSALLIQQPVERIKNALQHITT